MTPVVPVIEMVPPARPGVPAPAVPPFAVMAPDKFTDPVELIVTFPAFWLTAPVVVMVPAATLVTPAPEI